MKKKLIGLVLTTALAITAVSGCGSTSTAPTSEDITTTAAEQEQTEAATEEQVEAKKLTIAYATSAYPAAYQDDAGNDTGYSVEVMKLVDDALPQYEFTYEMVDGDAVLTGLSTGQYDIAIGSYVYTEERATTYILPDELLGIQVFGLVVKNEDADVKTLADAAEKGLVFTPLRPSDARYSIVDDYNEANPENAIDLQATDTYESLMEQVAGVDAGKYGFVIAPFHTYNSNVIEETGEYHDEYNDKFTLNLFTGVPHYTMVNADEGDVAAAIGAELGKLREDGTLTTLSNEWYGFNQFDYYQDDLTK